jgi:heterodisulfide reductase subunit C
MIEIIGSKFLKEIDPTGRLRVSACYQCGKCSSGCPMDFEVDLLPHQLIRLIQIGARDEVIGSRAIWSCASCGTCVSRCPMGVRTPEVIDELRAIAATEGKAEAKSRAFNDAFLGSVRRYGRVFEPGMLASYKIKSRDIFGDIAKGPAMIAKGKLKFLPPKGGDKAAVRRIFRNVREGKK